MSRCIFGRRTSIWFPLVLLGSTAFALVACKEEDYGDRALRFVETEVYALSRSHVEAALDNLTTQAMSRTLLETIVEAKVASQTAADTEARPIDAGAIADGELLAEFIRLDTQVATMFRLRSRLEGNLVMISKLDATCNDKAVFTVLGLGGLGMQGPVAAATAGLSEHESEFSVAASGGSGEPWYVSVGKFAASLIGANKIKQQNAKLREAVAKVPQKVVKEHEVFELYRAACNRAVNQLSNEFENARSITEETLRSISSTLVAVQAAKRILESLLRTRDVKSFLASSGVAEQLSAAQNTLLKGELATDITLRIRELRQWSTRIRTETHCLRALTAVEDFGDAVSELLVQLEVLQAHVSTDTELGHQVGEGIGALKSMLKGLNAHYQWVKEALCI